MAKTIHRQHGDAESEALFSSIGEGAIVTDIHGNVSRVNQAALQILDCREEDILGKWFPSVVRAEYEDGTVVPNLERPITKAFMTGKAVHARSFYRVHEGTRVTVDLTVAPVMVDSLPSGAIQVFRDVTQEVALERAKDEFISLASHQLRTPATGVKQYTSMLMEGYAGEITDAQQAMLQNIFDSNERQITIVNDLLKVAHVDAGQVRIEKTPTDVVQLICDVISEQKHKFSEHRQSVSFEHKAKVLYVLLDQKNIRMVVENILDNASKYTPDGKAISVTLKRRAGIITIDIKDEGVGIASADISKIFKKFSRLHNPLSMTVSGTGLGLYWAQKIIVLHGGEIKIKSAVGKGTTFSICIPEKQIRKKTAGRAKKQS